MIFMVAMPVMAQQPLTPVQVETIPFDDSRAGTPNTDSILNEVDMSEEVEGHIVGEGGAKAGLPQFDISTFASQIFWLAIMFVILYVFFARFSLPALSATIENRRNVIRSDLEEAEKLSQSADQTKVDYEIAMQSAHNDARKTITDAEVFLRQQAEQHANEFREKSAAAVANLENEADTAKSKIKSDLAKTASDLATDIINKLSGITVTDSEIKSAIADSTGASSTKPRKKAA